MSRYMTEREIVVAYFEWLLDKVNFNEHGHRNYKELMRYLHSVAFTSKIPKDENRIIDGLNLRDDFMDEEDVRGYLSGPCSILEMMVAFSIRIEIDITGDPGKDDLGRWFWVMIKNLGLLEYDDRHFDKEKVSQIVKIFIERKYFKDGSGGGLFPLFHPKTNQRETELWYQMQRYLSEHSKEW